MSVLIDTSVWIDHFRKRNSALVNLIEADLVLRHPMILVELACGTLPLPRAQTLSDIGLMQRAIQASLEEVMDLIEREKLYGSGCGLVDMALLLSTLITPGARLWTLDKRLARLSKRFGVIYEPSVH